jgi:hypothetical protein
MTKTKSILRKIIYLILFGLMIFAFVYLSEKYKDNSIEKIPTIKDYYTNADESIFTVKRGGEVIQVIKNGKQLLLIGNSTKESSQKYIEEIESILKELEIDSANYYDLKNDKDQKNSNYYEIRNLLEGYLSTSDSSDRNLLSPSFYIIENGKVQYYNTDTSIMKNTDKLENYWTEEKEIEFRTEITSAINKYYLNK